MSTERVVGSNPATRTVHLPGHGGPKATAVTRLTEVDQVTCLVCYRRKFALSEFYGLFEDAPPPGSPLGDVIAGDREYAARIAAERAEREERDAEALASIGRIAAAIQVEVKRFPNAHPYVEVAGRCVNYGDYGHPWALQGRLPSRHGGWTPGGVVTFQTEAEAITWLTA